MPENYRINPMYDLQGAPHPLQVLMVDKWTKPYSREYAAFPASWLRSAKFWPTTCMFLAIFRKKALFIYLLLIFFGVYQCY